MKRYACVTVLTLLVMALASTRAVADISGDTDSVGVSTNGLSPNERAAIKGRQAKWIALDGPRYEFEYKISTCILDVVPTGIAPCLAVAFSACASNKPEYGFGPLTDIWARVVDKSGAVLINGQKATPAQITAAPNEGYESLGQTCFPTDLPGAKPIPSVEMIKKAFHLTQWAKGGISTQPKGNVTLVNLKTFYQVDWSAAGFEPGEIDALDPATMFGFNVEVRPKLIGFVYHFGDGASEGPTTSRGGTYPDGDIVHTYTKPGAYQTNVQATFGADFRVNGGGWVNLPDTVVVQQPATPVTVREARAVLVQR